MLKDRAKKNSPNKGDMDLYRINLPANNLRAPPTVLLCWNSRKRKDQTGNGGRE